MDKTGHILRIGDLVQLNWDQESQFRKYQIENTDGTCIASADSCCLFTDDGGGPK